MEYGQHDEGAELAAQCSGAVRRRQSVAQGAFINFAPMLLALILVIAVCQAGLALAQDAPEVAQARYRAAFEAMMAEPANSERSFEFAQAAVAIGDFRGATTALERILQLNPGLANIQLELGVLYLRAGASDLAASYLRKALLAPDIPEPVRDRAQELLSVAERARHRHIVTGSIYGGGRYDSNANAGPNSRTVRVFGLEGLLDESATGQSDSSLELAAAVNYVYALESQAGETIEANFNTYNRRYEHLSELDINSLAVDVGPRFFLGSILDPSLSLRPFVSASFAWLDSEDYFRQLGAGLNLRKFFAAASYVELTLQANDQKFYDSPEFAANSQRSGPLFELGASFSQQLLPATRLFGGIGVARRNADADFESFKEGGAWIGATQVYPPPFGLSAYSWSTTLSASVRMTMYDDPDPSIDPGEKRQDTRVDVVLSNEIRITPTLTLLLSLQYTDNKSSLSNFEYDNTGVGLGLTHSF